MSPRLRPDACSVQWDDGDLPCSGTAAVATFWVALEQNGPWGHDALVESRLGADLGRRLADACARHGGRLLLVRTPGAHADAHAVGGDERRRVLVAGDLGGTPWLVEAQVSDPQALLDLPFAELATVGPEAVLALLGGQVSTQPALLVCTNGKRDVCCATRGRPLAAEAAAARPGRVWECSHTGGHRFAPTAVLLPTGQTLGRLTADVAARALDDAARGRLVVGARHDRGRSHLDPVVQAAECFVRERTGLAGVGDLQPLEPRADGPGVVVPVRTPDGEHTVRVERVVLDEQRRDSCAKGAVPSSLWRVTPA